MATSALMKVPAIDCQFGTAKVDDLLPLPSPFVHIPDPVTGGPGEVLARLSKVSGEPGALVHIYDLYLFGIWFGRVEAKQTDAGAKWGVIG